ncbi:MAG: hypothetical protein ACYCU0_02350 [Solirubrobacteraceae bacterium]
MGVPVVLPRVLVTVDARGAVEVSGEDLELPGGPVERGQLGRVLASITETLGGPVRVEVQEADGTRYADILEPRGHPAAVPAHGSPRTDAAFALHAKGFTPGETVLVAAVVLRARADANGTVSLPAAPARPRSVEELILLGSSSRRTLSARRDERTRSRRWWRA